MITVNAEKFWIAANFMSTEQTRYYISGVYVAPIDGGGVTVTATDGQRLAQCRDTEGFCDKAEIITVSKRTMSALKKADTVVIGEDNQLTLVKGESVIHIQPGDCRINGKFPDYSRVIPREFSDERAAYNAALLGSFRALYGFRKASSPIAIRMNGNRPALVHGDDGDVFGVLMPCSCALWEAAPNFHETKQSA